MTDPSNLERLKAWAETRDLKVRTLTATQREPQHSAQLLDGPGNVLLQRDSGDSAEIAAFYVINCLLRLGIEL